MNDSNSLTGLGIPTDLLVALEKLGIRFRDDLESALSIGALNDKLSSSDVKQLRKVINPIDLM